MFHVPIIPQKRGETQRVRTDIHPPAAHHLRWVWHTTGLWMLSASQGDEGEEGEYVWVRVSGGL